MRVLKFGGTSVGSAAALRQVVKLVAATGCSEQVVVVVSAMGGVTDRLVAMADGRERWGGAALLERHLAALREVAGGEAAVERELQRRCQWLSDALARHEGNGRRPGELRDAILACGERLALPLVAAALRAGGVRAVAVDASALVVTDSRFGAARVDPAATSARCRQRLAALPAGVVAVVPGFVGADASGRTTTLGRGGSDLSAAVIGAAAGASTVEIWTDVDGVLSAPPDLVPTATTLESLSFTEASVLAHLGAKVLHPGTVEPLAARRIPLVVRNTFNPAGRGTWVHAFPAPRPRPARAVTAQGDLARLSLPAMPPAALADALAELAVVGVEPVEVATVRTGLTSLLLPVPGAPLARRRLQRALNGSGGPPGSSVVQRGGLAVVAVVGELAAVGSVVLGEVLAALARSSVEVVGLANVGWPHAVSALVREEQVPAAVAALHHDIVAGHEAARAHRRDRHAGEATALRLAAEGGGS